MMAQDQAESTRELINHGRFINQFPLDIIKLMPQLKRINTKTETKVIYIVLSNMCEQRNVAGIQFSILNFIRCMFIFTTYSI